MNMMKTSLAAALLVALVGCQSTAEPEAAAEPVVNMSQDEVVAFMKACDNPDSTAKATHNGPMFSPQNRLNISYSMRLFASDLLYNK